MSTRNGYYHRGRAVTPLSCPMCGGELIYSDGPHDLVCERNKIDNERSVSKERGGQVNTRAADLDPPRHGECIFAVSFTESVHSGVLFSIRIKHAETDYNALAGLMREIQTRKRGYLARNAQQSNLPRVTPARSTEQKLAAKLGLAEEDLFSIKRSTETIKGLAQFYGITEGNVRTIKRSEF